jgi:MFS family permease
MLIQVQGVSATQAGAAFLPFSAIMGLGSRWAGGLAGHFGPKLPLTIGPALTAAGYALLGVSAGGASYWTSILPGLIVVACGMTISVPPLTTTVFDAAPAERSGTASGINNVAARAGGLTAVAALGLVLGNGGAHVAAASLVDAYRMVTFAAAALAALSAMTAVLTVGAPQPVDAGRRSPARSPGR